ncbi:TraR/DksA family transcriptional regulator [Streptomyces mirabilis]|jgi:RNA polymerase-binding protein DksA|uniref:Transcriptional regulator, TraR/DksA family n=1 Tax=Streptomyces mirabilis TaxID=68239 RepID=A0A1I2CTQ2_9ACTN|nr:TraR/DksA family transcriptional regulator [Streptomyces mirabilis]SFE71689.1 transcriptional regulator, TraR/DksA family [Streptomyces mirabilis]
MVAKKTAVQQSASGRSTGPAVKDVGGKKSASVAPVAHAVNPVNTATKPATKTATKAAAGKKAVATGKAAATKGATKKAVAKKAVAKKSVAKEAVTKEAVARKAVARKADGKSVARKSSGTARKSTSTAKKSVASAAEGAAKAAKTTGATTVVAKKTPGTATAAQNPTAVPKARIAAVEPGELAVRPGEDPWTPEEVAAARAELQSEALRLSTEISSSEEAIAGLMRDSGDGAGDDQADTGTKNITREHEMALAANAREMLEQTERALERLDAGTYGLCENCGNPIGKARMQAFSRATLCVECKQKQERRY